MLSFKFGTRLAPRALRLLSTTGVSEAEQRIQALLVSELSPTKVAVVDVSGGCGSMYNIDVESPLFAGKTMVAQHKMVTAVLKKEIENMHGLTIKTKITKD